MKKVIALVAVMVMVGGSVVFADALQDQYVTNELINIYRQIRNDGNTTSGKASSLKTKIQTFVADYADSISETQQGYLATAITNILEPAATSGDAAAEAAEAWCPVITQD